MPIISQAAGSFPASNIGGHGDATVTIQVPNATTLAEIALYYLWVQEEESHISYAEITQIVSAHGVENFIGGGVVVVFRPNVTSINFHIHVNFAAARARWMLHFYQ